MTLPRGATIIAVLVVVLHLAVAMVTPFEIHRDELLYAAMGRHLRLFAMDFPPFIAMAQLVRHVVLGDSVLAMRVIPALAHGALVLLVARLAQDSAREDRLAPLLAATATATTPFLLRAGTLFQPVIFEQLWWTLVLGILLRLGQLGEPTPTTAWLRLGAVAGLALLTKFSIVFLGAGVALAWLVTQPRIFLTRGPWLALAVTFAIGAPSWIGQLVLDWPVLQQMTDLRATQLARVTYPAFVGEQLLLHGPIAFGLAAVGLVTMLRDARFRTAGVAVAATFLVLMLSRGKPYYAGALFPALFAVGALAIAPRLTQRVTRGVAVLAIAVPGLVLLPIAVPLLSPEATADFAARIGVDSRTNTGEAIALEQDFADMLGWQRKVEAVAATYAALPETERRETVLLGTNYGRAGAIDFHGPRLGLPPAVSPAGSYWFFGPGSLPGRTLLVLGGEASDLAPLCGRLTEAARVTEPWGVPEERDVAVWLCREPHLTLQAVWPQLAGQN